MPKSIELSFASPNSGDELKDVELISGFVMATLKKAYGDDFPDVLPMQVRTTCCELIVTITGDAPLISQIEFAKEVLLADPHINVTH